MSILLTLSLDIFPFDLQVIYICIYEYIYVLLDGEIVTLIYMPCIIF
jgi:hypothetical protein